MPKTFVLLTLGHYCIYFEQKTSNRKPWNMSARIFQLANSYLLYKKTATKNCCKKI